MSQLNRVSRDAFLYLDPKHPRDEFAQCGTCSEFMSNKGWCAILDTGVYTDSSCGFYLHGTPTDEQNPKKLVSAKEAGLVHRQVRCENCKFFVSKTSICSLFVRLNNEFGNIFDLDTKVSPKGCCNAQTS
jgi:hypothetical protein